MRLTFSNNPLDKFFCWFENDVLEPISRYYYSKKKAHYTCSICGLIEPSKKTIEEFNKILASAEDGGVLGETLRPRMLPLL